MDGDAELIFLCSVCRRPRREVCHRIELECCGEVFQVCREVCEEDIPRICGGMTARRYVEFYGEIHRIVCKKKYQM